jgi:hypothetical protein
MANRVVSHDFLRSHSTLQTRLLRADARGVQIGVRLPLGAHEVMLIDRMVPTKRGHGLMAGDLHSGEGIHVRPEEMGRRRMAQVVKASVGESPLPARPLEGIPHRFQWSPLAGEHRRLSTGLK